MEFVFSFWYFVMIALVAGIVACVIVFVKMDKKDRVLIEEFINKNQSNAEVSSEEKVETVETENKTE